MKCELCRQEIQTTFLDKVKGTYIKDEKGKKHLVCSACQAKAESKEELISKL